MSDDQKEEVKMLFDTNIIAYRFVMDPRTGEMVQTHRMGRRIAEDPPRAKGEMRFGPSPSPFTNLD